MVTLINIIKNGNIVSADYYFDNSKNDLGHVDYDAELGKVISYTYNKEDEQSYLKTGFHKTVKAIKKLVEADSFPETYEYMWY